MYRGGWSGGACQYSAGQHYSGPTHNMLHTERIINLICSHFTDSALLFLIHFCVLLGFVLPFLEWGWTGTWQAGMIIVSFLRIFYCTENDLWLALKWRSTLMIRCDSSILAGLKVCLSSVIRISFPSKSSWFMVEIPNLVYFYDIFYIRFIYIILFWSIWLV